MATSRSIGTFCSEMHYVQGHSYERPDEKYCHTGSSMHCTRNVIIMGRQDLVSAWNCICYDRISFCMTLPVPYAQVRCYKWNSDIFTFSLMDASVMQFIIG